MARSLIPTLFAALGAIPTVAQTSSERAAVQLYATVTASPPAVTLNWTALSSTTSITIYRKLRADASWSSVLASPAASATQYVDNTVTVGTAYEYKVVRVSAGVTGTGYISSGVEVQPIEQRGKVILLVDNTLAAPLATELAQLEKDLKADGWGVLRADVSPTDAVSAVRAAILAKYNTDPSNVKALYIIGHVAVPYSGNVNPDGHSAHLGAWPCDAFYGDVNGSWTDNSVNSTSGYMPNWNVPGDGKFDQSDLPSTLELQVGRVDLSNLPSFSQPYVELMRAYLNKAHQYKVKGFVPANRALMFDNLQWVSNPLAASGWRSMAPIVGPSNILSANQNGTPFHSLVNGQSYLWTYSSGGGLQATVGTTLTFNGAANVGTTQDYAANAGGMDGVFNLSFGSYFGDWDNMDNFLRAPLANGDALTNAWSAIPAYYFHHMGMGEPVGTSVITSMNNTGLYAPVTDGWQTTIGRAHMGLMGDPSLRQWMVAPPSGLVVSNAGGTALFSWSASSDAVLGYYLYQIAADGTISRLVPTLITGTTYQSATIPYVSGREYMVRAVKLQTSPSGSYYDLSLGAIAVTAASSTDCLGVSEGTALPGTACNDGNACTLNDVWSAGCQCVGAPTSAVVTPAGPTAFCTGGSVVLNANTGTGLAYQWRKDAVNISGATSASYTASASGNYSVVVTVNGCANISSSLTVTASAAPSAIITAGGYTSFCQGATVTLNANTGTGLTYQWRKDGVNISGATGSSCTASATGSYTVIVTKSGCSATSAATAVTVTNPAASITAAGPTALCSGGSVVLNANTGSGLSYQWRKDGVNISGATAGSYTATAAGSYTVVVSSGGCSATSAATAVTVGGTTTATITAGGYTSFCQGATVTLNANTGTGLTYQWRKDGVNISGATGSSYIANATGNYTVTVGSGSCSATSAATTVTVTNPAASITAAGPTALCSGGNVVLNVNTGSGLSYQWRKDGVNISGATAGSYTATAAGSYTVVVSSGGCSATSAATAVTVGGTTTATITAGGYTSFCQGATVTLNANTGTGLTYQWRKDGVNISGATGSSYIASATGNYTVTVGSGSCSATSAATTVTVTNPAASITAAGPTALCSGGNVVLNANTGSGLSYQWRKDGVNISGATAGSYTATAAGSYTVVVSSGGCSATSAATAVTVGGTTTATITAGGYTSFCQGATVTLNANTGTGLTYQWRKDGVNISGATGSSYIASATGNYTVTVGSGGCSATSAATTVTVTNPAASITAAGPTALCSGGNVVLNANTGSGLSYQWRKDGVNISGATAGSYTATAAGSYTVVVSSGGCSATSAATAVTVGGTTTATNTAGGYTSFCQGATVTLNANTGTGLTYQWRKNGVNISGATGSSYIASATGNYTVTVGSGGCSATSAATTVTVTPAPTLSCSANTTNGTVSVTATGGAAPYAYSWNTSPMQSSATASVSTSGTYTVTVTSAGGCVSTCSTSIVLGDPCLGIRTETQATWGAVATTGTPAAYMSANFAAAFPSGLTIGCSRKLLLTSAAAVINFLPSSGTSSTLPSGTLTNPTAYVNELAGQLVAAKLSVRFDELNASFSPATAMLKDMLVASGTFAGWTVQQVIDEADRKIGGCGSSYSRSALMNALTAINNGYAGGTTASGYLSCPSTRGAEQVDGGTPTESATIAASVKAWPNPTSGLTTVEIALPDEAEGPVILEVRGMNGAVLHRFNAGIPAGGLLRMQWDASGLASGLYLCQVSCGEHRSSTRIMVE